MRKIRVFVLIILILQGCVQKKTDLSESKKECGEQTLLEISNPLVIEFEFLEQQKLKDGSAAHAFIEKGKDVPDNGDYIWSKFETIYASDEIKEIYEYQMDLTDCNFESAKDWFTLMFGPYPKFISYDNPGWYNDNLSVDSVYLMCKRSNYDITLLTANSEKRWIGQLIIDSGSDKTNTESEMAILFTIYN